MNNSNVGTIFLASVLIAIGGAGFALYKSLNNSSEPGENLLLENAENKNAEDDQLSQSDEDNIFDTFIKEKRDQLRKKPKKLEKTRRIKQKQGLTKRRY
jgi:hypothetical protein